ncbi:FadR/GntR family transcriptional regulator [Sphingomonas sp. ID0503]|uniref:FadR/GntR family transcriptional regulator n=1 Tax=Sphingomonas sp. ID0503 TaxID=3399691 RepID=UPI003AFA5784
MRLFEQVRDSILLQIKEGTLVSGSRLPSERALAEQFKVGRHAVREALRTLEMSGVLRFAKGTSGGAFVREKSSSGVSTSIRDMILLGRMPISDLTVVRINLLTQAVELAITHADAADYTLLLENIRKTEREVATGDPMATIGPVLEFNRILGRASGNPVLAMLIDSVADIMQEVLEAAPLPTEIDLIQPRLEILDAIKAGDTARAVHAVKRHYEEVTGYVLARLPAAYDFAGESAKSTTHFPHRNGLTNS